MKRIIPFLICLLSVYTSIYAQDGFKQTIRGKVIDKASKMSLTGASISLLSGNLGTTSNADGNFRIPNVPIGRQGIKVTFIGYKPVTIENLIVTSGKEIVLEIELEENAIQMNTVVISGKATKSEVINKMATVSARSFTIEETEKYAGSRGDVARMATNYAGVMAANDSRNDIVIRGNSPSGLLWRLDDIDIPNPNHFAENGTTGGPVGMLNNNVLMNSDFFTGAFPAEYGNALSGVFDLKLRNGNNEKHEFLFQSGFNGFELGAEGPFSKNHKSSYLINARYSTLELVSKFIDLGTAGVPNYEDISFKLNFPVTKGKITLFGVGGNSKIAMLDSKKTGNELYTSDGENLYNHSTTGVAGVTYSRFLSNKTSVKFILSGMYTDGGTDIDTLDASYIPHNQTQHSYVERRISSGLILNSKINPRFNIKSGITYDKMGFDLKTKVYKTDIKDYKWYLDSKMPIANGPSLTRSYVEASYHITDQIAVNPGVQMMYFSLNKQSSVEPRLGFSWQFKENQKLNLGYGLESKIQTLYTYYYLTRMPDNTYVQTNSNMGFTKSNQAVLGYDISFSKDLRMKLETYYQYLYHIPVEQRLTSFSILNTGAYWGANTSDSLVNKGTGYNYGMELTLEKFFSQGYYYLITASLFDSKYKGSDGVLRNTAFNGKFVLNGLLGKEFSLGNRKVLALDFKVTYAGGMRYTQIDSIGSRLKGEEVRFDNLAFSKQFPNFLKIDVKVGFRLNGKKVSQEWQFYVENVTNHRNFLGMNYNVKRHEERYLYQLGFFPMVLYRINF